MSVVSNRLATCDFIAQHAAELEKLAHDAELPIIAHIASMLLMAAREEYAAPRPKRTDHVVKGNGAASAEIPVAFAP